MANIDKKRPPKILEHKTIHLSLSRVFIIKCLRAPYLNKKMKKKILRYSNAIDEEQNKISHMRSIVDKILIKFEEV